jgi:hypothetical protein
MSVAGLTLEQRVRQRTDLALEAAGCGVAASRGGPRYISYRRRSAEPRANRLE